MKKISLLLFLLFAKSMHATTQTQTITDGGNRMMGLHKESSDLQRCHVAWNHLDETYLFALIVDHYVAEAGLVCQVPVVLKKMIHTFYVHEWTIYGFHKATGRPYDPHGFDTSGVHYQTGHRFDMRGFRFNGDYRHKDLKTGRATKYDPRGYDIDGWD